MALHQLRTAAQQALEAMLNFSDDVSDDMFESITALKAALAVEALERMSEDERKLGIQMQPVQEPVAWTPIEQLYPQAKAIDILMGDGSILCAVLPQFDGDLWWEGSGTGEKFIDPKYANVTHWRIHGEHTAPPQRKPLTEEEIESINRDLPLLHMQASKGSVAVVFARAVERAHGIGGSDE